VSQVLSEEDMTDGDCVKYIIDDQNEVI